MYLSRKKIKKLLNTNKQSNKRFKKGKRGQKRINRTLRRKRPVNLRRKSIKSYRKQKGGETAGDNNVDKIAMDVKLKEEKEARETKDARLKEEDKLGPSDVYKYEINADGEKKIDDQIKKLKARLNGISSASEQAKQRLTIIEAVMKGLTDTKNDSERDKQSMRDRIYKKFTKTDIDVELKNMSKIKKDLRNVISKYDVIKKSYDVDLENMKDFKAKKVYYEYTEPKSRISFYASDIKKFSQPYDKREGVKLIFPVYVSEPFFIETEFIGDELIRTIKDNFNLRNSFFTIKSTNIDSDVVEMINNYNSKSGELVQEDKKLDAALEATNSTSDKGRGVGSVEEEYAKNREQSGDVNQDTTDAMAAAKDEKANREAVDEALDAGIETAPPITGGQRGGASPEEQLGDDDINDGVIRKLTDLQVETDDLLDIKKKLIEVGARMAFQGMNLIPTINSLENSDKILKMIDNMKTQGFIEPDNILNETEIQRIKDKEIEDYINGMVATSEEATKNNKNIQKLEKQMNASIGSIKSGVTRKNKKEAAKEAAELKKLTDLQNKLEVSNARLDDERGRGANTVFGTGPGAVEARKEGTEKAFQSGELAREAAARKYEKEKLKDERTFKASEDISDKVDTDIKKDYYTSLTAILDQIIEEVNGITFTGPVDVNNLTNQIETTFGSTNVLVLKINKLISKYNSSLTLKGKNYSKIRFQLPEPFSLNRQIDRFTNHITELKKQLNDVGSEIQALNIRYSQDITEFTIKKGGGVDEALAVVERAGRAGTREVMAPFCEIRIEYGGIGEG